MFEVDERAKACGQDEGGRLWDVLVMFRVAAAKHDGRELRYSLVSRRDAHTSRLLTLKAMCGPGDRGEPVITIMLPDED